MDNPQSIDSSAQLKRILSIINTEPEVLIPNLLKLLEYRKQIAITMHKVSIQNDIYEQLYKQYAHADMLIKNLLNIE